ncbi:MAG: hypothetical protein LAO31_22415 [Acidobacteriia bacterium]|nr:hypothetical protein [Terriglobia bacterium]
MKKGNSFCYAGLALMLSGALGFAQESYADKATVPFSDASRPGTVKVGLISGSITVKGYAGKEVIVEAQGRAEGRSHGRARADAEGLKRIPNTASGLNVEEENNVVTVGTSSMNKPVDVVLQVPYHTSLKLKTINDGNIQVEQVEGEIEVNDINGAVTLTNVSGSVVAHALNGNVIVSLGKVDPAKSMSFSSLNGNIDVTFPADTKANVAMKSDQGEIYSDFDIRMDQAAHKPVVEDGRGKGGAYRFRIDKTMYGTINGGGPEMQFKTFNGSIYIRKKTK